MVDPGSSARVQPSRQVVIFGRLRSGWHRLLAFPFAVAIALVGVNSAVNFFVNPNSNLLHNLVSPWDYIWTVFYGLGGLAIFLGIALQRSDLEAAGCIAFAGGAFVNAITYTAVLHWHSWNTVVILLIFTYAGLLRGWHIYKGRVLLLVDTSVDGKPPKVVTSE